MTDPTQLMADRDYALEQRRALIAQIRGQLASIRGQIAELRLIEKRWSLEPFRFRDIDNETRSDVNSRRTE